MASNTAADGVLPHPSTLFVHAWVTRADHQPLPTSTGPITTSSDLVILRDAAEIGIVSTQVNELRPSGVN